MNHDLFDWDEANLGHLARHAVLPEEADEALTYLPVTVPEVVRNGEPRIVHLGETVASRLLLIVVTRRLGKIRVVTAMTAKRKYTLWYTQWKERQRAREESSS